MAGIITLILILFFSILIIRVASIALTHTGLSRESAKFQARSAYTGVGFTTSESEKVVNHPVRRKILQLLMILGNAGIVTGMASLIIGFAGFQDDVNTWLKVAILLLAVIVLWNLANSAWIERRLAWVINKILNKYTRINAIDYSSLLHLSGEYLISEIPVEEHNWLCDEKLLNTKLRDEGINVIAISRKDGTFIGNPKGETRIREADTLIVYGRAKAIEKLEKRLKGFSGNAEHKQMMDEQTQVLESEKENEKTENHSQKS